MTDNQPKNQPSYAPLPSLGKPGAWSPAGVGDANVVHVGITSSPGSGRSVLDLLSASEQNELHSWAAAQKADDGGSVNLMKWPGWATALQRGSRVIAIEDTPELHFTGPEKPAS